MEEMGKMWENQETISTNTVFKRTYYGKKEKKRKSWLKDIGLNNQSLAFSPITLKMNHHSYTSCDFIDILLYVCHSGWHEDAYAASISLSLIQRKKEHMMWVTFFTKAYIQWWIASLTEVFYEQNHQTSF